MICKNCRNEIPDNSVTCPYCGVANSGMPNDMPSTAINILSCCFPLVGLILYLVWRDQTPIKAKSLGKWALTGFIISIIIWVLYVGLIVTSGMFFASFS